MGKRKQWLRFQVVDMRVCAIMFRLPHLFFLYNRSAGQPNTDFVCPATLCCKQQRAFHRVETVGAGLDVTSRESIDTFDPWSIVCTESVAEVPLPRDFGYSRPLQQPRGALIPHE